MLPSQGAGRQDCRSGKSKVARRNSCSAFRVPPSHFGRAPLSTGAPRGAPVDRPRQVQRIAPFPGGSGAGGRVVAGKGGGPQAQSRTHTQVRVITSGPALRSKAPSPPPAHSRTGCGRASVGGRLSTERGWGRRKTQRGRPRRARLAAGWNPARPAQGSAVGASVWYTQPGRRAPRE